MRNWWNQMKFSWHRSLGLLWLLIIAHQWVSYTEPIWLRQTTAVVWAALITITVIEIIIPVKVQIRLFIEAAAIIYIVYRILINYGIYVADPWATTLPDRLQDIAVHMVPYIWFALGASALLLLSSWWASSKRRILWFIGMNIVALAALDSFTSIVLWQEVAWTVFAGMGWLVSQHLRSFQLQYPRGWVHLLKYPTKIVINIAIVFSLVILIGVNMPGVRPTLTDPYTAWQEWNGIGKSSGKGTVGTTKSEMGSVSPTNNTSSGYSLNDDQLGGGFTFDYTPVMTVVSDLRIYMRGETRRLYSGRGWVDRDRLNRGPLEAVDVGEALESSVGSKVNTRTLKQTVTVLNNNEFPVLFGTYSVSSVDSLNGEKVGDGLSWRSRDSELIWDVDGKKLAYLSTFEVTSEVPVIPVQELTTKTYEELYKGNDLEKMFLQLPNDFPKRVRELAEEITAEGKTPYEKTALLQQYLQQTFPYTNNPDISRVTSNDFVEGFLFELKEGYCDYYSTALVTMARSLNIPARWVKGYAPGEQPEIPMNPAQQQSGTVNNNYTITNADSHSWAEVYFGDYGWIPVEATPGFNIPLLTQSEQTPEVEPEDQEEQAEPTPAPVNNAQEDQGFHVGLWVVVAAVVVLLSWAIFIVWHRRFKLRFFMQQLRNGRPLTPDQKVVAETERWVRYLHRKGMLKEEHETLREAVDRWSGERPAVADHLYSLLTMFEKAKYSPEVIEDKDWQSVYTEALWVRRKMRSKK
ncbi:transglutaminase [Paenibacillus odorifer]|uniref:transglutaminase domain-containing protein n=1 Tax=Paenibacillus odorifer TaxID=189426 RepID=UPI00097016F5|nr:transglutaminase domain-containing protein [Paenibacillus odorifer]OMD67247.1 transglutaminase [Paenibacillus odorifer]